VIRGLAVAALLAGGCGDPGVCAGPNQRDPGPACTVAELAVTVDGDPGEWTAAALPEHDACADCLAGAVVSYQVARAGEQAVLVHATTSGAPIRDGSATYLIQFFDGGTASFRALEILLVGDDVVGRHYDHEFHGLPVDVAWGSGGFEARVPVDQIPFEGGAYLAVALADNAAGLFPAPPVCWVTDNPTDPCGAR